VNESDGSELAPRRSASGEIWEAWSDEEATARHFAVSPRTIRRWRAAGMPSRSFQGARRYRLSECEAWHSGDVQAEPTPATQTEYGRELLITSVWSTLEPGERVYAPAEVGELRGMTREGVMMAIASGELKTLEPRIARSAVDAWCEASRLPLGGGERGTLQAPGRGRGELQDGATEACRGVWG
jgi:hypothetical protein